MGGLLDKSKNKKNAIMESALELFTSKGFDNTSTASITKNAGVATGTLFTYFHNKMELINELYLSTKKELYQVLLSIDIPPSGVLDRSIAADIWRVMIRWGLENPTKMKFVIQYSSSPYITKLTWDGIDTEMEMIREIYNRSIEEGVLKDISVDYLSHITTSHTYSTIIFMIDNGIDDPQFIEKTFPTMWNMIGK